MRPRKPRPKHAPAARQYVRPEKPQLRIQPTTLWDYPSQHYGDEMQGDQKYVGATPSYVIWNVLQRYTKEGDFVVDPFCGSGTTLDVARDTGRRARGFDLGPYRDDIEKADARKLPIDPGTVDLVFMDPPYGDHIDYSDDPKCIGKLSAYDPRYFEEMRRAIFEGVRILKPGGMMAVYVCDYFEKKNGFSAVGVQLLLAMLERLEPIDIVCVTRHHKTLKMGNYRMAAEEGNFFLRGFNYLFLARKPLAKGAKGRPRRSR